MSVEHAAIIGAGVAGLTAALALAKHGISSEIFEQAEALTEVGAGLQISPNASRILGKLGVLERLTGIWLEPWSVRLMSGASLRELASVPMGDAARKRWGGPYGVLHRASLQAALLDAVQQNPLCTLHLGARIENGEISGAGRKADVLIGADGAWSKVRDKVPGSPTSRFSGNIAYRFTVSAADGRGTLDRNSVSAYLGSSVHLICYPLREAGSFNMVAITAGNSTARGSGQATDADRQQLLSRLSGWNDALLSLFAKPETMTFWPLYQATTGKWQNGSDTVLIGDAAHAMMPFAAQGAALAIEDAYELASFLARHPVADALPLFEARRVPRVDQLRRRGAFNKFAYHASGPIRIGRDIVLSLKSPQSLAADLDWIYGYEAMD
jgi:salicylate hydroxylase